MVTGMYRKDRGEGSVRADRGQKVLIYVLLTPLLFPHKKLAATQQLRFVLTTSGRAGRYVHVLLNVNRQFVHFGNSLDVTGKDKQRAALPLHPCWKAGKTALM